MATFYRFDPKHSQFTVQALVTGMLSFLGHNPVFAIRSFSGRVDFEDDMIAKMRLETVIDAASLTVTGDVKSADRGEIESRMRAEVLETDRYPEIVLRAAAVRAERIETGRYRMGLDGTLTLHGVTQPQRGEAELTMLADGLRLRGQTSLRMSDFAIRPVTALGGTIRLQDEVKFVFDLAARPEAL